MSNPPGGPGPAPGGQEPPRGPAPSPRGPALSPEALVRDNLDMVYNLALRLSGNAVEAEELASEVFLKALRALPAFRGEAAASTWLYRITVNAWKNRVQSRGWRWWARLLPLGPAAEDDAADGPAPAERAGPDPAPEAELERGEEARAVDAAVSALPAEERAALVLREFEGRSYQEIAAALGIPVGTVKSRIHRARCALAAALEGRHGA